MGSYVNMVYMETSPETPAHQLPRLPWLAVNRGDKIVTIHGDKAIEREIARVDIAGSVVTYWTRERWASEPVPWTTEVCWEPRIRRAG